MRFIGAVLDLLTNETQELTTLLSSMCLRGNNVFAIHCFLTFLSSTQVGAVCKSHRAC